MTHEMSLKIGETMPTAPQLLLVTPLGEHNDGAFGPVGTAEENEALTQHMAQEVGRAEYSKPPTNRWVCVDGRVSQIKMDTIDNEKADPQTAGGIAITELSVDYMLTKNPEPVSMALPRATKKAIANGQEVVVHGDNHKHHAGCACNVQQDQILIRIAANVDILAPIAWEFAKQTGIDKHIQIKDVTDMIATGGENARKKELWDLTPEEKVKSIVDNGGKYEELVDEHTERFTRADVSENAFDEAAFIRDHTDENGSATRAFSASLGVIKKYYFDEAERNDTSLHDAARQTMAAWLHNLGTAKRLSNENMQAGIYA